MNTRNRWILAGAIVVALVIGIALGVAAMPLIQRLMWGYSPAYDRTFVYSNPVAPGPMMGRGYNGPMFRMGPQRGGPDPRGFMGRGGFGPGPGMGRGYGYGPMMGGGFQWGGPTNSLVSVAAEQLDMTTTELTTELQSGKTIADLAQEKEVSLDKIIDAFLAPRAEQFAEMVANETLTQEQADTMLAAMKANLTAHLSKQWSPGGPGFGRGPMGRWVR
jgi:hypothetical protein